MEEITQDITSSIEDEDNQSVCLTESCTVKSKTTNMKEVEKEEAFADGKKGARASAVATDRNIGIAMAIGTKKGILDVLKDVGPPRLIKRLTKIRGRDIPIDQIKLFQILTLLETASKKPTDKDHSDALASVRAFTPNFDENMEVILDQYDELLETLNNAGIVDEQAYTTVLKDMKTKLGKYAKAPHQRGANFKPFLREHRESHTHDTQYSASDWTSFTLELVALDSERQNATSEQDNDSLTVEEHYGSAPPASALQAIGLLNDNIAIYSSIIRLTCVPTLETYNLR